MLPEIKNEQFAEIQCFLTTMDIHVDASGWESKIQQFYELIIAGNERMNLTRIEDPLGFLFKHVADSLLIAAFLPDFSNRYHDIADVGCGAGFPGIPIALSFSQTTCYEIDSTRKKINFVDHVIQVMNIPNCFALNGRARDISRMAAYRRRFDLVVTRAVGTVADLVRECRDLPAGEHGVLAAYKTPDGIDEEWDNACRVASKSGFKLTRSKAIDLPYRYGSRQLCVAFRSKFDNPFSE